MNRSRRLSALVSCLVATVGGVGTASAQVSQNVTFRSNWDLRSGYNDVWGYTHTNGSEYALLGMSSGTSVINVSNPDSPYETGFISGPGSIWRDIKTYQTYAYVVNETGGGLEIIDLSDPENPVGLANYTGFSTAHNLYIDESTGLLYTAGSNLAAGGTRILSLANPTVPVEVGSWETAYLHDVMVQNGRLYGSAIYAPALYILDVSNIASISGVGTISGYPNAFTHNAWVTADDNYVMTTDETTGAACRLWDISAQVFQASLASLYLPNPSTIPHNAHIDGDIAVISHYSLGVRIVDISDPFNIQEAGYYDTYPANDGGGYPGCWGAFPFFGTNPNLIVASDQSNGLFVLEYGQPTPTDAPGVAPAAGDHLELGANAPNPFRAGESTTMSFSLPAAGRVTAVVYDIRGRRVANVTDRDVSAGRHELAWDGRTEGGGPAPAGVYFLRLRAGDESRSRKMLVTR